jgi:hypothetical protein
MGALFLAPVLAGLVHAAAGFALAGRVVGDCVIFSVAFVVWWCWAGGRARCLGCYGLTRDGRREVFVGGFGCLGRDLCFDLGIGRLLLGRGGSVVNGCVLAFGAGSDSEEFVKGQDTRFATTIAFLALVEDGDAGCLRC